MWRRLGAAGILAFGLTAAGMTAADAPAGTPMRLLCTPAAAYWCDAAGCRPTAGPAALLLRLDKRTLARCDAAACTPAPYAAARSGAFTRYVVEGGAAVLGVDQALGFTDAAFLAGGVLVSFGACAPAAGSGP